MKNIFIFQSCNSGFRNQKTAQLLNTPKRQAIKKYTNEQILRKAISFFLVCAMIASLMVVFKVPVFGAVTVTVTKDNTATQIEATRAYNIAYDFNVTYDQTVPKTRLILSLDRSNSMLNIGTTNKPIVQSVIDAITTFLTQFYTANPQGEVAIVSFGKTATKSNAWNYENTLSAALAEVNRIYAYVDMNYQYTSAYYSYKNAGYRFAWKNWAYLDGSTNIKEGFQMSQNVAINNPSTLKDDVIILFTDGVATVGGDKYQENVNSPTSHNTNTIAAYTAGIAAQTYASVITVGYFQGLTNTSTKAVAKDTLLRAQNAGFFEAQTFGDLSAVFGNVYQELSFVGTNGAITEIVKPEFQVVTSSITPANAEVTTNANGETVIKWPIGNIKSGGYHAGYQVLVKADQFPSGGENIYINTSATLSYYNLSGTLVNEDLGRNKVSIPALPNFPTVALSVTRQNSSVGYLVGDTFKVTNAFSYSNILPFNFNKLNVSTFTKTLNVPISEAFSLTSDTGNSAWVVSGQTISKAINSQTLGTNGILNWQTSYDLTLKALKEGAYEFVHSLNYSLTDPNNKVFPISLTDWKPDSLQVKKSRVSFQLNSSDGSGVEQVPIYVNGVLRAGAVSNLAGELVLEGLATGTYSLSMPLPSGFKLSDENSSDVVLDANDRIAFNVTLNFNSPTFSKTIELVPLNVKDVAVTTITGASETYINSKTIPIDVKISFATLAELKLLKLRLVDDYGTSNMAFTLTNVKNSSGGVVTGFTYIAGQLQYAGSSLPADHYEAYGKMIAPNTIGDNGTDPNFIAYVDIVTSQRVSESTSTTDAITSDGLTVTLDKIGPVITLTPSDTKWATSVDVTVKITSQTSKIVDYKCLKGQKTIADFASVTKASGLRSITATDFLVTSHFVVQNKVTTAGIGIFEGAGIYTVYARDLAGNEVIKWINLTNVQSITDVLDNI